MTGVLVWLEPGWPEHNQTFRKRKSRAMQPLIFFSLKNGQQQQQQQQPQQQPDSSVRVCLGDLNGVLELKATPIIFRVHDSDIARFQVDKQLNL
jgi:hypothetical protein